MKTIKQIADSLGVDKQKVYRYIKKKCPDEYYAAMCHSLENNDKNGMSESGKSPMYFGEAVETLVNAHFLRKTASNDMHQCTSSDAEKAHQSTSNDAHDAVIDTLITMLQKELEIKNQQIEALNEALLNAQRQAEAAQVLHAADKRHLLSGPDLADTIEDKPQKSFWDRIRGK